MRFAFYTLGCKTNQFETAAMERLCLAKGHAVAPFSEEADIYVVNTCAVTGTAGKKSRAVIRQARRRAPGAVVAVCGCYSGLEPDGIAALGADLIYGAGSREALIDEAVLLAGCGRNSPAPRTLSPGDVFEPLPAGGLSDRTRALLKVEDGCDSFCAYCIIPYARGRVRSLPVKDAVAQLLALAEQGYKETVVTGIEISSYGKDTGETLAGLVAALCAAAPSMRLRLGSLEPRTVTEEFCRVLSSHKNLCPHFHLSLQSGCDETLRRMGRKYTAAEYMESLDRLRRSFPLCAVTADIIVGFPGETEEEFSKSLAFLSACRFSGAHVFPYSRREGTPAARMPGQVPRAEKEARAKRMQAAADALGADYLSSMKGKTLSVLFERREGGMFFGHSENYCLVGVLSGEDLKNEIYPVTVTDVKEKCLTGALCRPAAASSSPG